jgi:hypothetical protein
VKAAAILASALMFLLGWWVGRLQREAETEPRWQSWPAPKRVPASEIPFEDDDGVQRWDPPPQMVTLPKEATVAEAEIWREALKDPAFVRSLQLGIGDAAAGRTRSWSVVPRHSTGGNVPWDEPGGGW